MSLDINKLENVQQKGCKTTARCPACAEDGMDEKGEHLVIQEDGKFGCVLHPGAGGKPHRQRIFALVGIKTHPSRPKYRIAVKRPEDTPATIPGRFGRVILTYARARADMRNPQPENEERLTRTRVTDREASEASGNGEQANTQDVFRTRETRNYPSEASETECEDIDEEAEREARMARELKNAHEASLPPMLFRPPVRSMNYDDPNFSDTPDGSLVLALYWWEDKMTARLLYADPDQHCFWDCAKKEHVRPPRFYLVVCEKLNFDPTTGFQIIDGAICPF